MVIRHLNIGPHHEVDDLGSLQLLLHLAMEELRHRTDWSLVLILERRTRGEQVLKIIIAEAYLINVGSLRCTAQIQKM